MGSRLPDPPKFYTGVVVTDAGPCLPHMQVPHPLAVSLAARLHDCLQDAGHLEPLPMSACLGLVCSVFPALCPCACLRA